MNVKTFTLLIFIALAWSVRGQEVDPDKSSLRPCGTAPVFDEWFKRYMASPEDFPEGSADTLFVGVQIHLVANNNGAGRLSTEKLLDAFCQLNTDFSDSEIQFIFKNDWNLLNNNDWFQHDSIVQGIQMMFTNNVPDVLNAYFVSDPAGNCGYNLPYAGVTMAHGCTGPNDHTWTHEVGHALSIQHPFLGWEGKIYNLASPTPDTLTYDYTHFHSTPDTIVPAPLDTALVEYLDGSNCGIAADKICDSRPDYLSYRWNCDGQGMSIELQKDPAGTTFYSDGSLYMSYANDNCQNRFTPEQTQIMRIKLQTDKAAWLSPTSPGGAITGSPSLLSPVNGASALASGATLTWTSVPGATHYVVQASRLSSFAIREFEMMVTDTTAVLSGLIPNLNYYWRVRPFNYGYTCTSFSANGKFVAVTVGVHAASEAGWKIYPSRLAPGQVLTMEVPETWLNTTADIRLFDAAGRMLWQEQRTFQAPEEQLALPTGNWSNGVYHLICTSPSGIVRQPLMLLQN
ncbi:MAG: hypothetical protein EP344_09420 [Bacteroidetes bacterium]|nr:MAG: hypothetical protein EP344_09420 [Bacteroidota bacterium]